jgi:hypothetical protein
MIPVNDLEFQANSLENFFNENETSIVENIQANGSGVYKLTQTKQSAQFIAAEKVESVDDGLTINENGRISIIGEGEADDFLYVKFVV